MRMVVTMRGGWAGLVVRRELALDDLPPADAATVVETAASLLGRPAVVDGRVRDGRVYAFALEDGRSFAVPEPSTDQRARALLDVVRRHVPPPF